MRLPRLTTRRLMVIVAVIAVALTLDKMARRVQFCQSRAAYHDWQERESRVSAKYDPKVTGPQTLVTDDGGTWSLDASCYTDMVKRRPVAFRLAQWHATVKGRYLRAKRRPWQTIPNYPPQPEWFKQIQWGDRVP
jgi:hypothetical protein